ncbi:MAG: FliM/FliN family flagellar motor C-terminal domain-containing protein [Hyphomonas sp.]
MASGIPPTLLRVGALWDEVCERTRAWAEGALHGEPSVSVRGRRVVSGEGAGDLIEGPFTFFFTAGASPGICAIAFDTVIATRNAAARLGEEPDSLDEGPALFLKLLAEQSVLTLWQEQAGKLTGHDVRCDYAIQQDPQAAAGAFGPDARYFQLDLAIDFGAVTSTLSYLFELGYILRFAGEYLRNAEQEKIDACRASPKSLSDSVRASAIELEAVLGEMQLTFGECTQLEIGQVLPLPGINPGKLALTAGTLNGNVDIGTGELGVWKKHRALKLHTPVSDSFVLEIMDL